MDSRNTAFENYWASQWIDFDDTETTERRRRIAKVSFDAGWSAALTDDVQDSIRATARAEVLREAADRAVNWAKDYGYISTFGEYQSMGAAILADKQEENNV